MNMAANSGKFTSERVTTHGASRTKLYKVWSAMIQRCSANSKGKTRENYYGKGVRVCDRWMKFSNFLEDMGFPPAGMTIDRIDNDGNYEPTNCRWATREQQANNTSVNRVITYNGKTQTATAWAKEIGVKPNTIEYRLLRGIPVERALQKKLTPISKEKADARIRQCQICGQEFRPRPSQVMAGAGKYCSQKCNGAAKTAKASSKRV